MAARVDPTKVAKEIGQDVGLRIAVWVANHDVRCRYTICHVDQYGYASPVGKEDMSRSEFEAVRAALADVQPWEFIGDLMLFLREYYVGNQDEGLAMWQAMISTYPADWLDYVRKNIVLLGIDRR